MNGDEKQKLMNQKDDVRKILFLKYYTELSYYMFLSIFRMAQLLYMSPVVKETMSAPAHYCTMEQMLLFGMW